MCSKGVLLSVPTGAQTCVLHLQLNLTAGFVPQMLRYLFWSVYLGANRDWEEHDYVDKPGCDVAGAVRRRAMLRLRLHATMLLVESSNVEYVQYRVTPQAVLLHETVRRRAVLQASVVARLRVASRRRTPRQQTRLCCLCLAGCCDMQAKHCRGLCPVL